MRVATTGSNSATTAIAALLTFFLGAFAVIGDTRVAAAAAVVTAGILAAREDIHSWVARITWPELRSALVWLAMTFIVLPVVPDDPIGPSGGVNPRQIGSLQSRSPAFPFSDTWACGCLAHGMAFFCRVRWRAGLFDSGDRCQRAAHGQ